MEKVVVREDISTAFPFSPLKFVNEIVVVENTNSIPPAPILYVKLIKERNKRRILHYKFATLSELVIYFSTVKTPRGQKLYRYFLTAFLRKYNLVKGGIEFPVTLSYNDKVYVRHIGKQIYGFLRSRRPIFDKHKKRGLESPQGRNCSPRKVKWHGNAFPSVHNSYAKTLIFCQPL